MRIKKLNYITVGLGEKKFSNEWLTDKDGENISEKNFSAIFNKTVNFAAWSSDNKIFNILQKGLPGAQGIDSDIDSSLYVE